MAPKMLHPQLRKGFFKEGGVRKIAWRQKFPFSSSLSFPRSLGAIFSATNSKIAKTPPVIWPPVLGYHAAIRTAPNLSSVGLGLTLWLCSCVPLLNLTRKCSRSSQTFLLQTTLDGLCCTSQGDCREDPPLCHPGSCPEPPTLLSCSSPPCHPRPQPDLEWQPEQALCHSLPTALLLMVQWLSSSGAWTALLEELL